MVNATALQTDQYTLFETGIDLQEPMEENEEKTHLHQTKVMQGFDLAEQELLVNRALQGDHASFAVIVEKYSTLMLRTAYVIVGDYDTAEDIVQDAFIQAWYHLPDLRNTDALRPWMMRIVVNQCISFKRRVARAATFMRQALSEQEINLLASAADDNKGKMERDWDLAQAIESLPIKQRVAIALHYYNGMTLPEMATALSTSENTLKKRIQAALTNLRRIIRVDGSEEEQQYRKPRSTARRNDKLT